MGATAQGLSALHIGAVPLCRMRNNGLFDVINEVLIALVRVSEGRTRTPRAIAPAPQPLESARGKGGGMVLRQFAPWQSIAIAEYDAAQYRLIIYYWLAKALREIWFEPHYLLVGRAVQITHPRSAHEPGLNGAVRIHGS